MKFNNSKFSLKWMVIGSIFLAPSLAPLNYAVEPSVSSSTVLESLTLAEAQIAPREELQKKEEPEGKLSEGWKYAISGLVMLFFLGIALFVQLRAEREK